MKVNIGVFAHNSKDWERVQSGDFSRPPATPAHVFVERGLALGASGVVLGWGERRGSNPHVLADTGT